MCRQVGNLRVIDGPNTIPVEANSGLASYLDNARVGNVGGKRPAWAMRQAFRSPRYMTRWRELVVVQ
jgi:hypothetical protein